MVLLLTACLLTGCADRDHELERAMSVRAQLLSSSCSFDAEVTADYGQALQVFSLRCEADSRGNLGFRITAPETIADITGRIEAGEGEITYGDLALAFPLLAEDQLSPAGAPWVFYTALRGGYLTAAGMEEDLLRLTIDDSFEEDAMTVDIWLNGEDVPVRAEIVYDGRRILSLAIENFQIV